MVLFGLVKGYCLKLTVLGLPQVHWLLASLGQLVTPCLPHGLPCLLLRSRVLGLRLLQDGEGGHPVLALPV